MECVTGVVADMLYAVVYLNNSDACYDYVVGKEDADEFDDVKVVARAICPEWYSGACLCCPAWLHFLSGTSANGWMLNWVSLLSWYLQEARTGWGHYGEDHRGWHHKSSLPPHLARLREFFYSWCLLFEEIASLSPASLICMCVSFCSLCSFVSMVTTRKHLSTAQLKTVRDPCFLPVLFAWELH